MKVTETFRIFKEVNDFETGSLKPRRAYWKFVYTAALRMGIEVDTSKSELMIQADVEEFNEIIGHSGKEVFKGRLRVQGEWRDDIVVILKPRQRAEGEYHLVTFYPYSQNPDAKHSYTGSLVATALQGKPFDVHLVATRMHSWFVENPSVDPACLMSLWYEEMRAQVAKANEAQSKQLNDALKTEFENLELEAALTDAQEQAADWQKKYEDLQALVQMKPSPEDRVSESNQAVLVDVSCSNDGRGRRVINLHMSDGTVRKNNWQNQFDERLELAQQLKGRVIFTDVWNKANTSFKYQDWFKNIYLVSDEEIN
jgi:hypothetical protein